MYKYCLLLRMLRILLYIYTVLPSTTFRCRNSILVRGGTKLLSKPIRLPNPSPVNPSLSEKNRHLRLFGKSVCTSRLPRMMLRLLCGYFAAINVDLYSIGYPRLILYLLSFPWILSDRPRHIVFLLAEAEDDIRYEGFPLSSVLANELNLIYLPTTFSPQHRDETLSSNFWIFFYFLPLLPVRGLSVMVTLPPHIRLVYEL